MRNRLQNLIRPSWLFASAALGVMVLAAGLALNAAEPPATFRLAHLSPDTPAVDLYVNGTRYDAGLTFGQVGPTRSTGGSGQMLVEARLAGTSPDTAPLIAAYVGVNPGTTYVLAVANTLARLQIAPIPIATANLLSTDARVQVYNALPEGPRILVKTSDNVIIADGLGWVEDPVSLNLVGGQYRLIGATSDIPATLLFDQVRSLEPGTVTTVIVTGQPLQTIFVTTRPGAQVVTAP